MNGSVVITRVRPRVGWLIALGLLVGGCRTSATAAEALGPEQAESSNVSSLSRGPRVPVPALPAEAPLLRVLSFNVNFGVGHDPRNVDAIAAADADLVLLQETTDAVEVIVRERLSEAYPHMLFQSCCRAGGLGVLSKGEIVADDYLEPTQGWFPAWRVVAQTPVGPVQALNVHLRPPMSDGGSWVAGYFTTRDVRRREIEAFWRALDPAVPTLVVGDFNENAGGRAVAFLEERGLTSALPQKWPRAKTWQWETKVGLLQAMLDHIVPGRCRSGNYGGDFQLVDVEVRREGHSDHFPVLAVLTPQR